VDLYPTLAELAGLKAPRHLVGKSLVPVLADPTAKVRETALTTFDTNDRVNRPPLRPRAVAYSVRTERWRYTEWGEDGKLGAELYDHWNDPKEYVNLALAPHAQATVAEMKKLLKEHIALAKKKPNL
jgi:arylsulfatase A-like enzyme